MTSLFVRAARDLEALTEDEIGQLSDEEILLLQAHHEALVAELTNVIRRRHGLRPVRVPGVSAGRLAELCDGIVAGRLTLLEIPFDEWAILCSNDVQSAELDRAIVAKLDRGVA